MSLSHAITEFHSLGAFTVDFISFVLGPGSPKTKVPSRLVPVESCLAGFQPTVVSVRAHEASPLGVCRRSTLVSSLSSKTRIRAPPNG